MMSVDRSRLSLPLLMTLAACCALLLPPATARPQQTSSIEKRVSDQRLAELETLLAMAVSNRRMSDMPVGFGLIDPHAIGRRKRSSYPLSDALFREVSRHPAGYSNLMQLLSPSRQQEDQELGGAGDFGDSRGASRGSLI